MKKTDFNDLINYIKNRPEEAKRLREVLGVTLKVLPVWLSASDAAREIGMSSSWIRKHLDLFPSARSVNIGRFKRWYFRKDELQTQYYIWLFNENK